MTFRARRREEPSRCGFCDEQKDAKTNVAAYFHSDANEL
jgi:hypothetical protein